jgi:diguanylate cyclase (GGDEF)-like protein/PAS domain S-box-containing protein
MVAVRRSDDSSLVMRWPEAPLRINQPALQLAPFLRVQAGEVAGVVRGLSANEDVERIFGFQVLEGYPFFVVVGRSVDEQFALWEQTALMAAAIALATLALLLAVQLSLSRSRARLAQNEHHFDALIDSRHEVTCVWLPDTTLVSCNLRYAELLGKDASALPGKRWIDFIPQDKQDATRESLRTLLAGSGTLTSEREIKRPDGSTCWIRWLDQPILDREGRCVEIRSIGQDITLDKQNALRLRQLAQAVEQSPNSIVITNTDAVIEYANEAFTRATGYAPEEVIGKNPRVLNAGKTPRETYQALWHALTRGDAWRGEFCNTRKDGSTYIELATIAPIKQPDGSITHYVAVKEDITERRAAEERIQQLAYYDTLTGLPNRSLMLDRLRQSILSSERSGAHGMLLLLDVDQFKMLNDTQGHEAGDALLREVARRLQASLREEDTVARLGGDDFAVVVESLDEGRELAIAHAEKIAEQLHGSFLRPFELGLSSGPYRGTPSIGITLFQGRTASATAVLQQAEVALYKAKEDGRNTIRFYSESMQSVVDARAEMELKLRTAIAEDGFRLFYQPQLNRDGKIVGAEALIRCFDAGGRMIPPGDFIPLAEDTGLIVPIGHWVLEAACAQLQAWQQDDATHEYCLSINVSARQFHQPDFVDKVRSALEAHRIPAGKLKIELTESVVLGDMATTVTRMEQIKALGVRFALDDFGTGYSSLSYLKQLPFDQLKIDQAFVRDMTRDDRSEAIVRAILAMSRSLELEVVAEGVETQNQHELLLTRGCEMFQGYLFGKPVPIEDWR